MVPETDLKGEKINLKLGIFWSSWTGASIDFSGLVYLGNKLTKMTFDQKPLSDCKVGYFDFEVSFRKVNSLQGRKRKLNGYLQQ